MKWIQKRKSRPQINDTRIKKKFLLFPKCLDGVCRWLEIARVVQLRTETLDFLDSEGVVPTEIWSDIHWYDEAPYFTYKKQCGAKTSVIHPCDGDGKCIKNCELFK